MFCSLCIIFNDGCRDNEVFSSDSLSSALSKAFDYVDSFYSSEIESFEVKFISEQKYKILRGI